MIARLKLASVVRRPPSPGNWTASSMLRGYPHTVVSINGAELTSNAIRRWQEEHSVGQH